MWGFYKNEGVFENIFREKDAFLNYSEAFIKITRIFEDIFREIEAFFEFQT
jgi:hypothetical protein